MPYGTVNTDKLEGTLGGIISPDSSVFRNRIINGAMVIDQRNAGASVTPTSPTYITDRWQAYNNSGSGRYTIAQSSTAATGFTNSLLVTSTGAYSVGAGDILVIRQAIEGFNIADLNWGTANAKTVTLSFWVRSSLTGTFGGSFSNNAADRNYAYTYTINSANTWEQKTVTITGDTTGTWLNTNGTGLNVWFQLGVGSTYTTSTTGSWISTSNIYGVTGATSVVGTNGATFYLTGVQLEAGSTASSFEYRSYGQELALCQRYLPVINLADSVGGFTSLVSGYAAGSTSFYCTFPYKVNVRTPATGISVTNPTTAFGVAWGGTSAVSAITYSGSTYETGTFYASVTGATLGNGGALYAITSSGKILFTGCEL
jgi:hypothetical protein